MRLRQGRGERLDRLVRAFGGARKREAKSISGHQTLQLMKRPYGVKGNVYVVALSAFQRCLEDGPDAAERRPGSGFPIGRGTGKRGLLQ
ncbi:hypothetical protein ACS0TY_029624 [Phlomoides rotata]